MINFTVILLASGHGVMKDGQQELVLNEFDKRSEFYKLCPIERLLRNEPFKRSNVYTIGVFACCRQNYDRAGMTNLFQNAELV